MQCGAGVSSVHSRVIGACSRSSIPRRHVAPCGISANAEESWISQTIADGRGRRYDRKRSQRSLFPYHRKESQKWMVIIALPYILVRGNYEKYGLCINNARVPLFETACTFLNKLNVSPNFLFQFGLPSVCIIPKICTVLVI